MEYVSGALSGIKTLYQGMNPATLSGAIDVVVVKQPDGSFKCSPFHVRFGKLNIAFPAEKVVRIKINDEPTDVRMKLGPGGEAFFVRDERTDDARAATSPFVTRRQLSTSSDCPLTPMAEIMADSANDGNSLSADNGELTIHSNLDGISPPDLISSWDWGALPHQEDSPKRPTALRQENDQSLVEDGCKTPTRRKADRENSVATPTRVKFEREENTATPTINTISKRNDARDQGGSDFGLALSLCGREAVQEFEKHKITFEAFQENPQLLYDPSLVVQINGSYYPWDVAAPIIVSQLVYKAPLHEDTIGKLLLSTKSQDEHPRENRWWPFGGRLSTDSRSPTTSEAGSTRSVSPNTASQSNSDIEMGLGSDSKITADAINALEDMKEKNCSKSLTLDSDQLAALDLKPGVNTASFTVISKMQGRAVLKCSIHLWNHDESVVISDVDGTITKSDVLGHAANILGTDWTHKGVAPLYSSIAENGYKFLYLTSRSIGHAPLTRDFLKNVKQNENALPTGPILFSPQNFLQSIHREVIARNPQVFKIACLTSIVNLFPKRSDGSSPFYAGFGNRHTDEISYRAVNISDDRIYTVDPDGSLKMGMVTIMRKTSYSELCGFRDLYFPPRTVKDVETPNKRKWTNTNYWTESKEYMSHIDIDDELEKLLEDSKA